LAKPPFSVNFDSFSVNFDSFSDNFDLHFQSESCIADCKTFDEDTWEADYREKLSGDNLTEYNLLKGSEQSSKWNPTSCNAAYFKEPGYNVSYWSEHGLKNCSKIFALDFQILVKNWIIGQKLNFWSKIEILVKK